MPTGTLMTYSVDLFFSFRSPYSYLALPKTRKLVADYDVTVNLRPVYPLAVRVPGFFKRTNPQFARYVVLDSSRIAKHENIPFRFPRPDPIVQDMASLDVAEHQPYIHRLTRLGAAAQLQGRSLVFVDAISRVLWDGTVKGWNEGDHLASAATAAGFDLAAMDAAVTADSGRYEAVIAENEKAHDASGHWGVPTFVFENEPFFGQDRIELLIWRMESKGLTRR
jgi:2-hydroxychromene-2-carboxylate isomerase